VSWELKDRPEVVVGCLIGGEWVYRDMFKNALALYKEQGWQFIFETKKPNIDLSRNIIASMFLESKGEWLFFWDLDQIIPANTIPRLLGHRLPICSGLVWRRHPPIHPLVYKQVKGIPTPFTAEELREVDGQLVEVEACGMGCILIHRKVFEDLKSACERFILINPDNPEEELECWKFYEFIHKDRVLLSEDVVFCSKAKGLGYHIYVDTSIKCKHLVGAQIDETGKFDFTELEYGRM